MVLSDLTVTRKQKYPTHYSYELMRDDFPHLLYVTVSDNSYLFHMPNRFSKSVTANSLEEAMGMIDEPQ